MASHDVHHEAASAGDTAIAVIGLALRFPGASDEQRFWANLAAGVESIAIEQAMAGHVAAAGVLDDIERFDAAFFGYAPREAAELDPQHRIFLECAWSALEAAGYPPRGRPQRAGVYAGTGVSGYLLSHLLPAAERNAASVFDGVLGFAPDYLATRVAYELDLTGPALTVQTACSTSLVAVHLACQGLIAGDCDLALAGGVSLRIPQIVHHPYQEGGVLSPDGHCRAFDARGAGTVPSSGAGIVVLKRLAEAIADRDAIRAVVLGSAINNDGGRKAGFTAPSVDGQAAAIREAHAIAGIAASDIGYIEAHGTATPLGDPIELAALRQAFAGAPRGSCGIGSVKTNFGHLDIAAGIAGLLKAVLALEHRALPPSLHFVAPNPELAIEDSPFFVVTAPRAWPGPGPRRAGVSSFGLGGTNAHLVVEEPPALAGDPARRCDELIVVSARTRPALARITGELADAIAGGDAPLADIAHTLQVGRARFAVRRFAVGRDRQDIAAALRATGDLADAMPDDEADREPVFVFPGGGVQRVDMAAELRAEAGFRDAFDDCAARVRGLTGIDLERCVFAVERGADRDALARALDGPLLSQVAIFACSWAIARQWLAWGVAPRALLGHSLGEYAAACLAGVFSLDDALRLVVARGRILEQLPPGAMVSVLAPVNELAGRLDGQLSIAAVNGPGSCVIAGACDAIARFESQLEGAGIEYRRLRYARASHCALLDPYLDGFERTVRDCALAAPSLPIASPVTGGWLTADDATDPAYWRRHFRDPVRFSDALATLLSPGRRAVIEAGPGGVLSALVRQHPAAAPHAVVATSAAAGEPRRPLDALGEAWRAGVPIDWQRFRAGERRCRVALPTYSFDRERYWVEAAPRADAAAAPRRIDAARPAPAQVAPAAPAGTPRPPSGDAAPPGDTERAVLDCFRELFHLQDIGVHDSFFARGGDSLLAIRLMALIARRCGVRLPLKAIAEAPSAAALARRIAEASPVAPRAAAASCLVELQPGRGTPVFLVHGGGGHAIFYRDLAHAIDPERTIYGFEARGLDGLEPLHGSVEDMAAHYVELARAAHPGGPYLLAGASFGGMVAYEMARQLTARGAAVPLCALIDAPGPGYLPPRTADDADILAFYLDRLVAIRADELRGRSLDEQLAAVLAAADARGRGLAFSDVETGRRLMAVWKNNFAAMVRYAAPPWPGGEIQFFAATERDGRLPDHVELAWIGRCAVRVERAAGDHLSMVLPPHAAALGAQIRRCIEATPAAPPPPRIETGAPTPGTAAPATDRRVRPLADYALLGRSGLRVSPLCLGTMTFGTEWGWGATEPRAREVLDRYLDAGGNFIDTADIYTAGTSERWLGAFLAARGDRDRVVLATKFTFNDRPGDPNAGGNSRKNIYRALDGSLRRLQTDYIDLYWLHAWDGITPIEEVMSTLDDLVTAGKIRCIGLSNTPAWYAARAQTLAEQRGEERVAALQLEYSLIERNIEREHIPAARALGMAICPWSPLAGGMLTGKYARAGGAPAGDGRLAQIGRINPAWLTARSWEIVDAVAAAAGELGRTPAQVALNWVTRRPGVTSTIIGATSIAQLEDNLRALEFELPEPIAHDLEARGRPAPIAPYLFESPEIQDQITGGTTVRAERRWARG